MRVDMSLEHDVLIHIIGNDDDVWVPAENRGNGFELRLTEHLSRTACTRQARRNRQRCREHDTWRTNLAGRVVGRVKDEHSRRRRDGTL